MGHNPNSGEATITAANGAEPQTVLQTRDDVLFEANQIVIEYDEAATAATEVTIYDDADGTGSGAVGDARKTIINLSPGDVRSYDRLSMRRFDEDVLAAGDNNQDGNIYVYVDGVDYTGAER